MFERQLAAFAAAGLLKGGLLATEAAASLAIYLTKTTTFRMVGALPADVIVRGLTVGASLMIGTVAGKAAVIRMKPAVFEAVLDGLMLVSGAVLLATALRGS